MLGQTNMSNGAVHEGTSVEPQDIIELLRTRPFEPFKIALSDGKEYEILHPEMALVDYSKVVVGIPGPEGPDGPLQKLVSCSLAHLTRMEPITAKT